MKTKFTQLALQCSLISYKLSNKIFLKKKCSKLQYQLGMFNLCIVQEVTHVELHYKVFTRLI